MRRNTIPSNATTSLGKMKVWLKSNQWRCPISIRANMASTWIKEPTNVYKKCNNKSDRQRNSSCYFHDYIVTYLPFSGNFLSLQKIFDPSSPIFLARKTWLRLSNPHARRAGVLLRGDKIIKTNQNRVFFFFPSRGIEPRI